MADQNSSVIELLGIGALVPVEVRRGDSGTYVCTSPLVKGLLVVTQDKDKIAQLCDQALRDLYNAVRIEHNASKIRSHDPGATK